MHPRILQTALPLGGLGAGCVCLNGHGGLQDFSLRHNPDTTAYPLKGVRYPDAGFAVLRAGGARPVTLLVEGPFPREKIYDQGIWAAAYRGGYEGLPRFRRARFTSGYPFGRVELEDPEMPLAAEVLGWSPFVPLDDVASGIPCALLEYRLHNRSRRPVSFQFSYHLSHLANGGSGWEGTRNRVLAGRGVLFTNTEPGDAEMHGSASLTVLGHRPRVKAMWLRGGPFDAVSALWRELETGGFEPNDGQAGAGRPGRNGGSILVEGRLRPGGDVVLPVVLTWHFPNSRLNFTSHRPLPPGWPARAEPRTWHPFYATQWADAGEVAAHVHRHYWRLRERTVGFQRALLGSTLPREVLDAVSANLAIVKSPTLLRQASGNLWAWEGCGAAWGSCAGSCTHVWNYAQALPHLFPRLERTLREQELERSMDDSGHVNFRSALPDGPVPHTDHAAADGQLGGIMKLYRDWHISGDTEWLRGLYPRARRSLEYCIRTWDPRRRGGIFEPHHNTYDIEFWGPDGMVGSIYVGALAAMAAMARAVGADADHRGYQALAARAARFMESELFNGEYYEQRVQYRGLRDRSLVEKLRRREGDPATLRLLRREGPKYQYGTGCLSDGVIGAWMAALYGVETGLDPARIRRSLRAIHRHNFRRSLWRHANCQRSSYALGEESGLLLCSWPRGGKPTLPFIYSDEVWTGIEYQVASHLALEGLRRESLELVRAVRRRHDGATRNPWNEYEAGSYYARAMASYALLAGWSGFRYSAVDRTLHFAPPPGRKVFSVFFATASGYGTLTRERGRMTVALLEGGLALDRLVYGRAPARVLTCPGAVARPGVPLRLALTGPRSGNKE
ncbi:MAG: hypothetical protein JNG83_07780 [Opitutaceae bacterium]|nr:hypothetical protein [Opitutaceae bacterium]